MATDTKAECVELYGVRVIPGDATEAMIAAGLEALSMAQQSNLNNASLVLLVLDLMCEAGDLTSGDQD